MGGTTKVQSFKATDTLQDVLTWLGTPTILMTTFPKRVFTNEDAEKTLKDLGIIIQTLTCYYYYCCYRSGSFCCAHSNLLIRCQFSVEYTYLMSLLHPSVSIQGPTHSSVGWN